METKAGLIAILMATIIVSGCSALPGSSDSTKSDSEPKQVPGKGLEVVQYKVSDNTLTAEQSATLTLKLKNYHRSEIDIGNISLYNLGLLSASEKECAPDEIEPARQGVAPVMECTWTITAPSEDLIGGFSQRKTSVTANIPYNSSIENFQPFKLQFKPEGTVNHTRKKFMTFSNNEIKVKMETENPIVLGQEKLVKFDIREVGSGRVDGKYRFKYSPKSVFDLNGNGNIAKSENECPAEDKAVLENKLEFGCHIKAEGSVKVVRNLFFTVSYKYVKAPSLDITIVS